MVPFLRAGHTCNCELCWIPRLIILSKNNTIVCTSIVVVLQALDATSNAVVIPKAQIPLYPHNCMCQSMDVIASSVNFRDSPIPITPTCSRRTDCDGISCLVTAGFGSSTVSNNFHLLIDPCRESVRVTNTNSSGMTVFDEVYNDTGVYDLKLLPGANTKLSVGIVHRNFSMRLSVSCE